MENAPQREMPKYTCHKQVSALKITGIVNAPPDSTGVAALEVGDDYLPITVYSDYMEKHKPQVGGYYVVYADGYKSFSPADVFEAGYTLAV